MSFRRLPLLALRVAPVMLAGCALIQQPTPNQSADPAAPLAGEASPTGQLPKTVLPIAYTLEFTILPEREGFSGRTQIVIEVKEPSARIWLHGLNLRMQTAAAQVGEQRFEARYTQVTEEGLVALDFDSPLPVGRVLLTFSYEADFDRSLRGLYRVDAGDDHYAFTQFEPYAARLAFPGFDEPAFKTPFDVWVTTRVGQVVVANAPEQDRESVGDEFTRIRFKRTQPLPTYLVALAVGPLDVVEAPALPATELRSRPIALRGIAARGKGPQLRYALTHTPVLVEALEGYFGIPYPYAKLDVIAVPDFASGAMENAGAITFREWLLLLDSENASQSQKRAFADVMAHELAHQWFGNLVTMPWWDDIWLNEAFATWMSYRTVHNVWPDLSANIDFLSDVHRAMDEDALMTARMIRQPIESTHDIAGAFDAITYTKGGGVLAMFERYMGEDRFRKGIRSYLKARPFGTATAEDLLVELSAATDKDLSAPFNTFLTQSGVPLVRVQVRCEADGAKVALSQERYLPVGSEGSRVRSWQIPICLRYGLAGGGDANQCTLLKEPTAELPISTGCPSWVMPNADAAGYYLWSLKSGDLGNLIERGFDKLSTAERMSVARSVKAGLDAGIIKASDALEAFRRFARADARPVITAPMAVLSFMHDHVVEEQQRPALQAYARKLYSPLRRRLGFGNRKGDDGETKLLRRSVLNFLASTGRDPVVRKRMARVGRLYLGSKGKLRPDAVDDDLLDLAVRVALEDGDEALFGRAYEHLIESEDAVARYAILGGLSSVRDERSKRALELALDDRLRTNEATRPLWGQMSDARTREAAWTWFVEHFDQVAKRISGRGMAYSTHLAEPFCSTAHSERLQKLFVGRIEKMQGGPRHLAQTLESLSLCDASVQAMRASATEFLMQQ